MEHLCFDEMMICSDTSLVWVSSIFLVVLEGLVGVVKVVMDEMLSEDGVDVVHFGGEDFVSDTVMILFLLLLFLKGS